MIDHFISTEDTTIMVDIIVTVTTITGGEDSMAGTIITVDTATITDGATVQDPATTVTTVTGPSMNGTIVKEEAVQAITMVVPTDIVVLQHKPDLRITYTDSQRSSYVAIVSNTFPTINPPNVPTI